MALLLASTFFAFAIAGRILIQYHYTGDHGVRFAKRTAPLGEVLPGLTFVGAFAASIALLVLDALEVIPVRRPAVALGVPATLLGFLGIAVTVIAQIQMGQSWRIGVDPCENTELVTTGLYARSRNPIYFGIFLYWTGICVNFPHAGMWLCAIVCWASIEMVVRKIEEPYLASVHGDGFETYRKQTHRYLIV